MQIYCCACKHEVEARLTTGAKIYPHRPDLALIPVWQCDTCKNYVGCHYKTVDRTRPLGNIPTPELRKARQYLHFLIDRVCRSRCMSRKQIYTTISNALGYQYHTAEIRTIEDAKHIQTIIERI